MAFPYIESSPTGIELKLTQNLTQSTKSFSFSLSIYWRNRQTPPLDSLAKQYFLNFMRSCRPFTHDFAKVNVQEVQIAINRQFLQSEIDLEGYKLYI